MRDEPRLVRGWDFASSPDQTAMVVFAQSGGQIAMVMTGLSLSLGNEILPRPERTPITYGTRVISGTIRPFAFPVEGLSKRQRRRLRGRAKAERRRAVRLMRALAARAAQRVRDDIDRRVLGALGA